MNKPRAHYVAQWNYWIVRSLNNGTVYQGVGKTLDMAYYDWFGRVFGSVLASLCERS
jgi:hypothetical protein